VSARRPLHAVVLAALLALPGTAIAEVTADALQPAEINARYVLTDSTGRMVDNEDFSGRYQLISFGYTACADVCPTTLATMVQIRRRLGDLGQRLQLIFITLDPERDTREVLARYTAYFDADIIGLTGSPEMIQAVAGHYKISFGKYLTPAAAPGLYSIDHTTGLFLLGPDGLFVARFAYDAGTDETAARIRKLMQPRAAP
jgi:cytochrome oxidase Cu insertion factor (SCO1/SenC/PrrC family)